MIKKNKTTLIFTTLVLLLPILIGLLLWDQLPEQVPSHWDINGQVDAYSSKAEAVFTMPLFLLALHWFCALATGADPKVQNINGFMLKFVLWICPVLSLLLNTMVYAVALGHSVNVEVIMPMTVGALMMLVGNWLPKFRQSYTMGIKLPWTLDNEENWNKTHRFAGKIWVIGGVIIMATAFLGNFWLLMGALLAMVLLPTVYSYLLYRKQKKA